MAKKTKSMQSELPVKLELNIPSPLFGVTDIRLNWITGIAFMTGMPVVFGEIDLVHMPWWMGVIGLAVFFLEAWATSYKINLARVRFILGRSAGRFDNLSVVPPEPGTGLWYGFLLRLCMRIGLVVFSLNSFGVDSSGELPVWVIGILMVAVVFELVHMMFVMFESRAFRLESSEDSEVDASEKGHEYELDWRRKMVKKLDPKRVAVHEVYADFIVVLIAMMCSHMIWEPLNDEMIAFLSRSFRDGEAVFGVIMLLVTTLVYAWLFVYPLKVSYWVEQSLHAVDSSMRWKYRLSFWVAALGMLQPSFLHLASLVVNA